MLLKPSEVGSNSEHDSDSIVTHFLDNEITI